MCACILENVRTFRWSMVSLLWVVLVDILTTPVYTWQVEWQANSKVLVDSEDNGVYKLWGSGSEADHYKIFHTDDQSMLIGGKNMIYNLSLTTLRENARLQWNAAPFNVKECKKMHRTEDECQNYIKVLMKKNNNEIYVCGTNAFHPMCRRYIQEGVDYKFIKEESGVGMCPYSPSQNNTAVYTDNQIYSGTTSDFTASDPLIYRDDLVRSQQHNSKWLNGPHFVNSFGYGDKVYFFFRETAVENINCGKAVFGRVARICKKDTGGGMYLLNSIWTSFFKARLNCSIPGDYPYHFDEIQSTSDIGQGNFMSTHHSGNRSDMIYAVFNTPENSIQGSAICAFRFSDIEQTFMGKFKGQETAQHNWLSVSTETTPHPHPHLCVNDSQRLKPSTLDFIQTHPLMDDAVPVAGGSPILIKTGFRYRFTQIAIDWQVYAVDRYYDILFIGTDNGRVIKAVNKGLNGAIEPAIIEDMVIFGEHEPITSLKVHRQPEMGIEKLIVTSKTSIASIPLHRCHRQLSCSQCVSLQDPYCSWADGKCVNTNRGLQSVRNGTHSLCHEYETTKLPTTAPTQPSPSTCKPCLCPQVADPPANSSGDVDNVIHVHPEADSSDRSRNTIPGARVGSSQLSEPKFTAETLAISLVVAIVVSIVIGFLIGYKVNMCHQKNIDHHSSEMMYSNKTDLRKSSNIFDSENQLNTSESYLSVAKQLNVVLNVQPKGGGGGPKLSNNCPETKTGNKIANKVYL